jgi:hypothetical protein
MPTESERRIDLAREIAAICPPALGAEIAVTGSASRGCADADSDIELDFWVAGSVDVPALRNWLQTLETGPVIEDPGSMEDSEWFGFAWKGVWVEAGWQRLEDAEQVLADIVAGRRILPGAMMLADVVANAVPVRTGGILARWQALLATYPEELAAKVIENQADFWGYEHWVKARWAAGRRGHILWLNRELQNDLTGCLRLIFALNRRWEPDWKWLPQLVDGLEVVPERLVDRIDAALLASEPAERVGRTYELVLDTLALAPQTPGVRQAIEVVQRNLHGHG